MSEIVCENVVNLTVLFYVYLLFQHNFVCCVGFEVGVAVGLGV